MQMIISLVQCTYIVVPAFYHASSMPVIPFDLHIVIFHSSLLLVIVVNFEILIVVVVVTDLYQTLYVYVNASVYYTFNIYIFI